MSSFNRIKLIALVVISAFVGVSCEKDLDVAPVLTYSGKATMTIAELNELHTAGSVDSYDSIPNGTVISGIITSSDKDGNCYKFLTIQDNTGAIQIKIDDSHLYPKYQIGQRVFVECGDMVIGDYRKNNQIGFWADGSMVGIASSREDQYIFRHDVAGAEPAALEITSKDEITSDMYNRLVCLKDCHFSEAGSTYCNPGSATSRDIVMADNSVIVMRTSNYASFASSLLPEGEGDIYGILTVYNTTPQLVIRSLSDVRISATPTAQTVEIVNVDFTSNPFETQGWSVIGDNGGWFYYAAGQSFAIQNQTATALESWLISPVYSNLGSYSDVTVTTTGANCQVTSGTAKKYYSVDFNGTDVAAATWTELPANGKLPAEVAANPNVRIAFYFNGYNGDYWRIPAFVIKGTIIQ